MSDEKKIPKRRFKQFLNTPSWEQRKLGEVAEIVRGASPRPIADPKWFDNNSDIGWLRISDVTSQDGRIKSLEQRISKLGQEKTRVLMTPHLLLSIAATVGKPVINYVPTGVHDGFLIFMNPKFNIIYTFWWLEMFKEKWNRYGQPGSQVNLNSELVKNQGISLPSDEEQIAISYFFENIDNLITLHQRKLNKLENLKKAYLEELFADGNQCKPKRRFKDFKDDWEQRKLGEVASLRGGYAFKSDKFLKTGVPIIRISNILSDGIIGGEFAYYYEEQMEENFLVKDKSILIAMSGATTGKVGILHCEENQKFYQNQRVGYFEPNDQWSYKFIGAFVKSKLFEKQLDSVLVAGAQPNISSRDINDFDICISKDINEQNQIGVFFEKFDNLITLHQRKLQKLMKLKEAYLEEMFV